MDTKDLAKQQAIENFKRLQSAAQTTPQATTQPTPQTGGYFEKGVDFGGINQLSDIINPVKLVQQVAEDIVNIPSNIIGGAGDILQGQFYRGAGRIGTGLFDIATTFLPPAKALKLGGTAVKALKPTLGQALKTGAKEGVKLGAISGAFQGLQQAQDVNPADRFSTIATNIVSGGVTGGLLGGGITAAGAKISGTGRQQRIFTGATQPESRYKNFEFFNQAKNFNTFEDFKNSLQAFYHGTPERFSKIEVGSKLNVNQANKDIYLTPQKELAEFYKSPRDERLGDEYLKLSKEVQNIEKEIDLYQLDDSNPRWWDLVNKKSLNEERMNAIRQELQKKGKVYSYYVDGNILDTTNPNDVIKLYNYLKNYNTVDIKEFTGFERNYIRNFVNNMSDILNDSTNYYINREGKTLLKPEAQDSILFYTNEFIDARRNFDNLNVIKKLLQNNNVVGITRVHGFGKVKDYKELETIIFDKNKLLTDSQLKKLFKESKLGGIGGAGVASPDLNKYLNNVINKQIDAGVAGKPSFLGTLARQIDLKLQDFTQPLNEALRNARKQGLTMLQEVRVQDKIDRVLRSSSLANNYINKNLSATIQKIDDTEVFNQYLIAKQGVNLAERGIKTGRDLAMDKKLINEFSQKYEPIAQEVYNYTAQFLKDYKDAGLISDDLYNTLRTMNKEYVPFQRVFATLEENLNKGGGAGVASVYKQDVVKRIKGSEREVVNPLESIFSNTYLGIRQIEKNKAAKEIYDLVKGGFLPGKIYNKGENFNAQDVIYVLIDGKKVAIEVGRDIASAVKNLNSENMGVLGKIFALPTKILRIGAVGLNIPFIFRNIIKDQQTALVFSKSPIKGSLVNPINYVRQVFEIANKSKLYQDFLDAGAGYSSMDIGKDLTKSVERVRSEKNIKTSAGFYIKNPRELFNLLEDSISTTELAPRVRNFGVRRDFYMKNGYSLENATILAANEARNLTANFARRGEWSNAINALIPFFNAGIQGARQLRNRFVDDPKRTTIQFTATLGLPITALTLYSTSDPERKKAYEMIPEYEKERAMIILPPVPYYDAEGNPFYWRVPLAPGLSNLINPIRKLIEGSYQSLGDAGVSIANEISTALYSQGLPVTEEARRRTLTTITPQALKPFLESTINQNLYTGAPIIPRGMENLPPEYQVRDTTSGTARSIGAAFGISPLIVENSITTSAAGVGQQVLNILDTLSGVPAEQRGGKSIFEDVLESFYRAQGGAQVSRLYDQLKVIDQEKALLNLKIKDAIAKGDVATVQALSDQITSQQYAALKRSVEKKELTKNLSAEERAIYNLTDLERQTLAERNPQIVPVINKVTELKAISDNAISSNFDSSKFRFKNTKVKKPKKIKIRKPRIKKIRIPRVRKPKIKKLRPIKPVQI